MLLTLTPIGAPVDYLKQMVEDKIISEHVGVMSVENCWPEGFKTPLLSQADIDDLARSYLSLDREARMNGSWDAGIPEGRIFDAFTDEMISDLEPAASFYDDNGHEVQKEFQWSIGIDHGHDVSSQAAILSCIDMTNPDDPIVYIVDEYISDGAGANKHARGILQMLRRNNLEVADITRWTGDRRHGGTKKGDGRMSNGMLMSGFAHELGYQRSGLPFKIRTAYKPKWSLLYGCQVIHERMINGKFQIFPTCKMTINSMRLWARKSNGLLDLNSQHKHSIDAMRYGVMPIIDVKYRQAMPSKLIRRW